MKLPSLQAVRGVMLVLTVLLGGCGGGGGFLIGLGDSSDEPPTVSLVAGASGTVPGSTLRLAAAAVDDTGIAQVRFFRREDDGSDTFLGSDAAAPYELDFLVPADADTDLRFFARATDDDDQDTDSSLVTVTLE